MINKLIFKRSSPGLRSLIYIGLAIALIILDHKSLLFQKIHTNLVLVVFPLQYLVNVPVKTIHWIAINVTTQQKLIAENVRLQAHEFLLESKLQQLLVLERENTQLRNLLQLNTHVRDTNAMVAQLLAVNLDPTLQQIIVDKGTRDHICIGQPVLDAYGVVGQVIHSNILTSKVMLISDPKSAVPVQDYRNGIRAIAIGMGSSGKLMLINATNTSDIRQGDLFISSGLGLCYPLGYPVGVVFDLKRDPTKQSVMIILQPSAHLDQLQQVLIICPHRESLVNDIHQELMLRK